MMYEYSLRQQIGERGYFATVGFEINQEPSDEFKITFEHEADEVWRTPCLAGIQIFSDYFSTHGSGLVHIKVVKVDWMPVDSNSLIVLFAVVQGLCQYFKLRVEGLGFDNEKLIFSFPELRSVKVPR